MDTHIKQRILIIEDDRELASIVQQMLSFHEEREIEIVNDGQNALARILEMRPDLIILDLNLPHVSGAKIFQEIQVQETLKHIPVIILTADGQAPRETYLQENATMLLVKPVEMRQLRRMVKRLLY